MKPLHTIQKVINLIKQFEGFRSSPYRCPGGRLTIGFGHIGPDVVPGLKVTEEEAEVLLRKDLELVERAMEPMIFVELSDNQFSACASLTYNIGISAFRHSTLLKKINDGDLPGAAMEFLKWDKVNGIPVPGLLKRRKVERDVFHSL